MSLSDKLSRVPMSLLMVTENVGHYEALKKSGNYIVWAEDGEADSLWADGAQNEQVIQGTIDYFTLTEHDPNFDAIQAALSAAGISFRLNSIQYETDTGYIHYEWIFEVV